MTEAQKILSLIENVSPDDINELNHIDVLVSCYLQKNTLK